MAVSCKSHELIAASLACPQTEHKVHHCYATNKVYHCLVAGQLYLSCRFSSADCRCFQVSNPCQAIHSTAFVDHIRLTDRDFLIRIAFSCEIFMILFIVTAISVSTVSQGKVAALSRSGGKIKHLSMAYIPCNKCAKNSCKRTIQLIVLCTISNLSSLLPLGHRWLHYGSS